MSFQVNDKVFYPFQGAGVLTSITQKEVLQENKDFYVIFFNVTNTTMMLPVDNIENTGLRHLSDKKEIKKALEILSQNIEIPAVDWKERYKSYMEEMKTGKLQNMVTILKGLYTRNGVKELSSTEKKFLADTTKFVVSEISMVLEKPEQEVKEEVKELLEHSL